MIHLCSALRTACFEHTRLAHASALAHPLPPLWGLPSALSPQKPQHPSVSASRFSPPTPHMESMVEAPSHCALYSVSPIVVRPVSLYHNIPGLLLLCFLTRKMGS